jgi:Mg2+-importing ATPase
VIERQPLTRLRILWHQLRSPLLLVLLVAASISLATRAWTDAAIVLAIVLVSVVIGFRREHGAQTAAEALRSRIVMRAEVLRDGGPTSVPVAEVVPGDVIRLAAGSLVPADAIVVAASDLYVNESILTGESFPAAKRPGRLDAATPIRARSNSVFLGTNVRSGAATCLVVATGRATAFGAVADRLSRRPPVTEFERGVSRFAYLLASAISMLVLLVFAAHVWRGRPPAETLLFSIALAVGLSPELLPAILSVNLARGAVDMARHGVLVRRLAAIENLGSIDVLCTDKTGTLTEGVVRVEGAYDPAGVSADEVLELAAVNASLSTGLPTPLDDAILAARRPSDVGLRKLAELPFDFVRKRVGVVIAGPDGVRLIVKGAFRQTLAACATLADGTPLDANRRRTLEVLEADWNGRGIRVVAVAVRPLPAQSAYTVAEESGLAFAGFLTFLDNPKPGAAEAVASLARLGVDIKIVTGDSLLVSRQVAERVGLHPSRSLTGAELDTLQDEALWSAAPRTDLFAEVDPNQKERILLALKKSGHVVGFLGDGVNDAPAMHAADASLSVESAADVAREAADFVLLERDLDVIRRGVEQGRRTFANTLKYVLTTTSANLGNMLSMAVASLFLPFLPLTAGQILLNNFLSDLPAAGYADDSVDPELVAVPRRWDVRFIGRFMLEFGALSSLFDLATFAMLLGLFRVSANAFRTGWFVESLLTELAIALLVRTRRPAFRSRPGKLLLGTSVALAPVALALPYLPFAGRLGFVPLPAMILGSLVAITAVYALAVEGTKAWFYRRIV